MKYAALFSGIAFGINNLQRWRKEEEEYNNNLGIVIKNSKLDTKLATIKDAREKCVNQLHEALDKAANSKESRVAWESYFLQLKELSRLAKGDRLLQLDVFYYLLNSQNEFAWPLCQKN